MKTRYGKVVRWLVDCAVCKREKRQVVEPTGKVPVGRDLFLSTESVEKADKTQAESQSGNGTATNTTIGPLPSSLQA